MKWKFWSNLYIVKKFLVIHEKLIQKMWCIEKIICIFNNTLQKISSQNSFLWESENDHKKDCSPESFVTIGSFDCDHTLWQDFGTP
jgi:hypothetical protein